MHWESAAIPGAGILNGDKKEGAWSLLHVLPQQNHQGHRNWPGRNWVDFLEVRSPTGSSKRRIHSGIVRGRSCRWSMGALNVVAANLVSCLWRIHRVYRKSEDIFLASNNDFIETWISWCGGSRNGRSNEGSRNDRSTRCSTRWSQTGHDIVQICQRYDEERLKDMMRRGYN